MNREQVERLGWKCISEPNGFQYENYILALKKNNKADIMIYDPSKENGWGDHFKVSVKSYYALESLMTLLKLKV